MFVGSCMTTMATGFSFGTAAPAPALQHMTKQVSSHISEHEVNEYLAGCQLSQEPSAEEMLALEKDADETNDVILEVEGKQLHTSRIFLARFSPVFHKMFFSEFREKSESTVALPGKNYKDMAKFLLVMYPQRPDQADLIADDDLIPLLKLADEYQVDHVKARCQDYIGQQIGKHYRRMTVMYKTNQARQIPSKTRIDCLSLYVWMCDQYQLPIYRKEAKTILLQELSGLDDIFQSQHYSSLPLETKVDLLETLCRKLDGSLAARN